MQRDQSISPAPTHVRGASSGLMIPAHAEALEAGGAEFLTRAFHAYGSLPQGNRVKAITRIEPCQIGSTGQKLFVSVAYEHSDPRIPAELFLKFSRHFGDPFHDRRRFELESEIRFYQLARKDSFPISVPRCMFADFDPTTGTGLLITQRIPFGETPIEPLRQKCMDHEMEAPLEHYRAIVTALARLAGAHRAGRLSPEVEAYFPFDAEATAHEDSLPWSEQELQLLVDRYAQFAQALPQLLPEHLRTPDFIRRLEQNVLTIGRREAAIRHYLLADDRFVALTHFNGNIDNAWFWRLPSGALECGLFDWQRARQMNVACALWGSLCAAGLDIWTDHIDELLALFAEQYRASGGPELPIEELRLHLHLYVATVGMAGMLDAPTVIRSRLPDVERATGRLDPHLLDNEGARCFLHVFTNFLNFWDMHGFGNDLEALLERTLPSAVAGSAGPQSHQQ